MSTWIRLHHRVILPGHLGGEPPTSTLRVFPLGLIKFPRKTKKLTNESSNLRPGWWKLHYQSVRSQMEKRAGGVNIQHSFNFLFTCWSLFQLSGVPCSKDPLCYPLQRIKCRSFPGWGELRKKSGDFLKINFQQIFMLVFKVLLPPIHELYVDRVVKIWLSPGFSCHWLRIPLPWVC